MPKYLDFDDNRRLRDIIRTTEREPSRWRRRPEVWRSPQNSADMTGHAGDREERDNIRRRTRELARNSAESSSSSVNDLVPERHSSWRALVGRGARVRHEQPRINEERQRRRLIEKREEMRGLRSEVHTLKTENKALAGESNGLRTELFVATADERTLLDDVSVVNRWTQLGNIIAQIVDERYRQPLGSDLQEDHTPFTSFVGDVPSWLGDEERREWLFQAYVWRELTDRVFGDDGFSANSYNLAGKHQTAYLNYLQALREESQNPDGITRLQYQKLKAAMNMILGPIKSIDTGRVTELASEIETKLLPYQHPDAETDAVPSFEELIEAAASLDSEMAKCRAWYQVTICDVPGDNRTFGMEFNSETMREVHWQPKSNKHPGAVSLILSPLLIKWGDYDGNDFHLGRVLAPRKVVCSESQLV